MNKKSKAGKFVFIGSIIILLYALVNSVGGDMMLKRNGICTKAILYRETFGGKTKPSLGYKFSFNRKIYDGLVVQDGVLKIGDGICVIYLKWFPKVNRPARYFENEELKCNCGN